MKYVVYKHVCGAHYRALTLGIFCCVLYLYMVECTCTLQVFAAAAEALSGNLSLGTI